MKSTQTSPKYTILFFLRLICKYYIAYYMFSYAFGKILKTQFSFGPVWNADSNISEFNGFMITWYYYGYSRTYGLIIAACQILAGILILFRKTQRIGVILLLSFMVNILMVNYFYKIGPGAMQMAFTLTTMGLFLLVTDWRGFKNYFFYGTSKPLDIRPPISKKLSWLPILIIPILLYIRHDYINSFASNYKNNELVGVWKVIPKSPKQEIYKMYFDKRFSIKVKDFSRNIYYGEYTLNNSLHQLSFNAIHSSEIGSFMVNDSIAKMNIPEDSLKIYKKEITKHFSKKMGATFVGGTYSYQVKSDTLIIIDSLNQKQRFLNISNLYSGID